MKILNGKLIKVKVTEGNSYIKGRTFLLVKIDRLRYYCIDSKVQFFDLFREIEEGTSKKEGINYRGKAPSYMLCNTRIGMVPVDEIQIKNVEFMTLNKIRAYGLRLCGIGDMEKLSKLNIDALR